MNSTNKDQNNQGVDSFLLTHTTFRKSEQLLDKTSITNGNLLQETYFIIDTNINSISHG